MNLKLVLQAVDRASAPISRVTGTIGSLGAKIGSVTGRLGKVAALGGAVGAGVAVLSAMKIGKAAWSMVKEAADAGDAALNEAPKVGLNVIAFQRLAYAAKLANLEQGSFTTGLRLLASNADAAARGGKEDAKAFSQVGVSLRDVKGQLKPTDALLADIADRFQAMPDGPRKTAYAMRLFGRSGADMIPMLNQGSRAIRDMGDEAERLGAVLSLDAARAGDEFNDNMDRMRAAVFGLKIGIGAALLPTMNQAIVSTTKWIAAHRPAIMEKVNLIVGKLATALGDVDWIKFAEGVGDTVVGVTKLFTWIGGLDGVITTLGVVGIGQMTTSIFGFAAALGVLTGPIGWTILGIGALAAGAFVLWRNWDKVSAWAVGLWTKVKTAFVSGTQAVWNAIPKWLQFILKGVGFVLKVATNPTAAGLEMAQAGGQRMAANRAAVPSRSGGNGRVQVDVRVNQDGRVSGVRTKASGGGWRSSRPRGAVRAGR